MGRDIGRAIGTRVRGRRGTTLAVATIALAVTGLAGGCGGHPASSPAAGGAGGGSAAATPATPGTPTQPATSQSSGPAKGPDVSDAAAGRPDGAKSSGGGARGPALIQKNPGWGLDRITQRTLPLNNSYRANVTGQGVTVYLIDGGLEAKHKEFEGRASIGVDFVRGGTVDCVDEMAIGHGTFVAGIVGGRTTGVARKVKLVGVRTLVCGDGVQTPPNQVALIVKGIDWVRAHAKRPAVVNMSLNEDKPTPALDAAVRRLVDAGIPVVVSAGNDAGDACRHSPAGVPTAITVAASDRTDRPWEGSNLGRCVTVFAPGSDITSVALGGGTYRYTDVGATSWAAPYVTGAAALYLSTHPNATPAEVKQWIVGNSTKGVLHGLRKGTPNRLLYSGGL